jgi:hypothetical protein
MVAASVIILHGPAVELALTGDSYQWVQHAHAACHEPALLLADLDTFLRPSTTWTLVLSRVAWSGFDARGYRASSLVIHVLAAVALAVAGRRLGLGWPAATAVALVWATSPFTDESVFVVAYRFQPLLLLSWLVLIAAWPRRDERWVPARTALVTAAVVAAAAAKETWVVTPALAVALELDRRATWREMVRPVGIIALAAAVYVGTYFLLFPGSKSYYELGEHVMAKIPSQLAAFLYLREPMPFAVELSWFGIVAVVAVIAMAGVCLRWQVEGTWTALALLLLPTLPTLLVPFMPQRYLAIPYAGFLVLSALWFGAISERWPERRWLVRGGVAAIVVALVVAGASIVRADLADYRRMAAAHARLLDEAVAVAPAVAAGGAIAVVRDEGDQPLLEILREPVGFAKLPYTRHADPSGLIDAAALFEWVIAEEGTRVRAVSSWPDAGTGVDGGVLVHTTGGFVDRGRVEDLGAEIARWRRAGRRLRVIEVVRR